MKCRPTLKSLKTSNERFGADFMIIYRLTSCRAFLQHLRHNLYHYKWLSSRSQWKDELNFGLVSHGYTDTFTVSHKFSKLQYNHFRVTHSYTFLKNVSTQHTQVWSFSSLLSGEKGFFLSVFQQKHVYVESMIILNTELLNLA